MTSCLLDVFHRLPMSCNDIHCVTSIMNDPIWLLQIEEINFRDDDISAEMIPVPQKKGRGRPRKYLRLEDVLEWRQQNQGGQENEKVEKEPSSDNQAEDIKRSLQESQQHLLVKDSDSISPLQQKQQQQQQRIDVSSFDSNSSHLKQQQDNEKNVTEGTVEYSNTFNTTLQQQQQQQLVIESNLDIDEWSEDNCESVQEETIVDETITEIVESPFDNDLMTSLKDSDESVTLYGGAQGVNVINNFLIAT
jgi:hypothetical protein